MQLNYLIWPVFQPALLSKPGLCTFQLFVNDTKTHWNLLLILITTTCCVHFDHRMAPHCFPTAAFPEFCDSAAYVFVSLHFLGIYVSAMEVYRRCMNLQFTIIIFAQTNKKDKICKRLLYRCVENFVKNLVYEY